MDILICSINEQQYGFELGRVNSVILAVEVSILPNLPNYFLGAVNVHGQITLVLDMRKLLGLPKRDLDINDQFILYHLYQKQVALWVNSVKTIKNYKMEEFIPAEKIFPDLIGLQSVLKDDGQMIFLYDLEKLLPSDSVALANSPDKVFKNCG